MNPGKDNRPQSTQRAQSVATFLCVLCELCGFSNQKIIKSLGNQTRDFVYIEDVAESVSDIMEKRSAIGEVFNIGTGIPTPIKELAETIIRISNKELEPKFEQAQIGDIRESYADITKARKILGYKPKYLLEQGLKLCMSRQ